MKIRSGFVSNSSSSSFIIGVVVISEKDVEKYNKKNVYQYKSGEKIEYPFEIDSYRKNITGKDYIKIESFSYQDVSTEVKDGDWVLFLNSIGPEGDWFFWNNDYDEMNYDKIDLSDFSKEDVELYEKIRELGGDVNYGAGRDG